MAQNKSNTPKKPDRTHLAQLVKRANSRLATLRKKGFTETEAIKSAMVSIEYLYRNIKLKGGKPDKFVTPTKAWAKQGIDVDKTREKLERVVNRFLNASTSTVKGEKASREKRLTTFKTKFGLTRKLTESEAKGVFKLFDFINNDIGRYMLSSEEILNGAMKGFASNDGEKILKDIETINTQFEKFEGTDLGEWKPAVYRQYLESLANGFSPDPKKIMDDIFSVALQQAKAGLKSVDALEEYFDKDGGMYD